MFKRRYITSLFALPLLIMVLVLPPAVAAGQASVEAIATGLNNPRGLDFGPEGALYVGEGGSGGAGPCGPGPEGERCYGATASVTRIDLKKGDQERVAVGIPSLATKGEEGPPPGAFASGVQGISLQGRGGVYMTTGYGGDPRDRESIFGPDAAGLAQLARMNASGNWQNEADLGAYETNVNPAGDEIDSNPFGILALPGKQIVADAGANDLLEIRSNGDVSTLAVFPDRLVPAPPFLGLPPGTEIPMEAVPTSVVLGPGGNYYVGELTGFPFPAGDANVYLVPEDGGEPTIFAGGFTAIIGLAFGPDNSLYVLEIAKNGLLAAFADDWTGALIRVAPDGTRTEIASNGLFAPGGVTMGPDGALYVTNYSIFSGAGEVLRIRP